MESVLCFFTLLSDNKVEVDYCKISTLFVNSREVVVEKDVALVIAKILLSLDYKVEYLDNCDTGKLESMFVMVKNEVVS